MQSEWDDHLANNIDFSDEEDVEEEGGVTIKNAAKYGDFDNLAAGLEKKQNDSLSFTLNYYKRIEKLTKYPEEE